jgi:broad specificity phosphatase PhoE
VAILLIRHGETASNAARVVQTPETPLSEQGLAQARLLARRLSRAGIGRILASDLERAAATARILADATRAPLSLEPLLQERSFGALRGTPYAELTANPFEAGYAPPEGETWADFHERVDRAWAAVEAAAAAKAEGHLAVVTHGLVCHSILARLVRLPAALVPGVRYGPDGPPLRFGNTALTVVEGPSPWTVARFACVAHLAASPEGAGEEASGL